MRGVRACGGSGCLARLVQQLRVARPAALARRCILPPPTPRSYKPYIFPRTEWDQANVEETFPHQRHTAPRLRVRARSAAEPPHLAAPRLEERVVPVVVWPVFYNFGRTVEHLGGWLHDVFRRDPALHAAAKLVVATPAGLGMLG